MSARTQPARVKYAHSVKLSHVKVENRHRKDMGDIQGLADSLRDNGLLQPIGVTGKSELVFGHRRLEAAKLLGWNEIPCVVVDLDSIVTGEYAENEIRKDFTLSERDSIRRAIESEEKAKAKERKQEAGKAAGKAAGRGRPKTQDRVTQKSAEPKQPPRESRTAAAKRVGLGSHDTATKVGKVVDKGTPELVQAMDKGTVSVNAAAKLAELPKPKQQAAAKAAETGNKKAVREAVKEAEQQAKPEWARGPSPKEAARNSPARRWTKLMHDLYVAMNSVRDCGGIEKLTRDWSEDEREKYVAELRQIIGRLNEWIIGLEL